MPESYDERVIDAAKDVMRRKIAKFILIQTGRKLPFTDSNYLTIIDINFSSQFANQYFAIRKKKVSGYTFQQAESDLKSANVWMHAIEK